MLKTSTPSTLAFGLCVYYQLPCKFSWALCLEVRAELLDSSKASRCGLNCSSGLSFTPSHGLTVMGLSRLCNHVVQFPDSQAFMHVSCLSISLKNSDWYTDITFRASLYKSMPMSHAKQSLLHMYSVFILSSYNPLNHKTILQDLQVLHNFSDEMAKESHSRLTKSKSMSIENKDHPKQRNMTNNVMQCRLLGEITTYSNSVKSKIVSQKQTESP